ncbi:MAG: hypothetical protein KA801_09340 [Syntrophorhabdaceae bacterium]|nr:hypothetical protein [Syntrophorhabdaceae bacterium]
MDGYTLGAYLVFPGLRNGQNIISRLAQGSSPFTIKGPSTDRNFLFCDATIAMFLKNCAPST